MPEVGFQFDKAQLSWLLALPALSGATMRLFYAFLVPVLVVAAGRHCQQHLCLYLQFGWVWLYKTLKLLSPHLQSSHYYAVSAVPIFHPVCLISHFLP